MKNGILVLSRRVGERVVCRVGELEFDVKVMEVKSNGQVRLAFLAPPEVVFFRPEVRAFFAPPSIETAMQTSASEREVTT